MSASRAMKEAIRPPVETDFYLNAFSGWSFPLAAMGLIEELHLSNISFVFPV